MIFRFLDNHDKDVLKNKSSNKKRFMKLVLFLMAFLIFIGFSQIKVQADTDPSSSNDVTLYIDQSHDGESTSDPIELQVPFNDIGTGQLMNNLKSSSLLPNSLIHPSAQSGGMIQSNGYTGYARDDNSKGYVASLIESIAGIGANYDNKTDSLSYIADSLKTFKDQVNSPLKAGDKVYFKIRYYDPVHIIVNQIDKDGNTIADQIKLDLDPGGSFISDENNFVRQGNTWDNIDNKLKGLIKTNRSLVSDSSYYQDEDGNHNIIEDGNHNIITDDVLNTAEEALKKSYPIYYTGSDSVSDKDANAVVSLLSKSFALTGTNDMNNHFVSGSGNAGKIRTINLVFGPEKETPPDNNNSSSSGGDSNVDHDVEGVELYLGTSKDKADVNVYDNHASLLSNLKLAPGTDWYTDEQMTINGTKYYRVATNQWVRANDIYLYYNHESDVRVNSDHVAMLVTSSGKQITNRALQKNSDWYSDRYTYINNTKYYRVSTNEFVSSNDVSEY